MMRCASINTDGVHVFDMHPSALIATPFNLKFCFKIIIANCVKVCSCLIYNKLSDRLPQNIQNMSCRAAAPSWA